MMKMKMDKVSKVQNPGRIKRRIKYNEFITLIKKLQQQIENSKIEFNSVYGIPRGGVIVAGYLTHRLNLPFVEKDGLNSKVLVVDDINDSGKTLYEIQFMFINKFDTKPFLCVLFQREGSKVNADFIGEHIKEEWIVFPWEVE